MTPNGKQNFIASQQTFSHYHQSINEIKQAIQQAILESNPINTDKNQINNEITNANLPQLKNLLVKRQLVLGNNFSLMMTQSLEALDDKINEEAKNLLTLLFAGEENDQQAKKMIDLCIARMLSLDTDPESFLSAGEKILTFMESEKNSGKIAPPQHPEPGQAQNPGKHEEDEKKSPGSQPEKKKTGKSITFPRELAPRASPCKK